MLELVTESGSPHIWAILSQPILFYFYRYIICELCDSLADEVSITCRSAFISFHKGKSLFEIKIS